MFECFLRMKILVCVFLWIHVFLRVMWIEERDCEIQYMSTFFSCEFSLFNRFHWTLEHILLFNCLNFVLFQFRYYHFLIFIVSNWFDKRSKCTLCIKTFVRAAFLRDHIATKHANTKKKFKCLWCDCMCSNRFNLKKHIQLKHPDQDADASTTVEPTFVTIENVNTHLKCEQCTATFRRKENLTYHIEAYHSEPRASLKCTICDKAFVNKSTLTKHHLTVHIKDQLCEFCGHEFGQHHKTCQMADQNVSENFLFHK